MLIKPYRDRSQDLEQLTALGGRRDCPPRARDAIALEIRKIRAGQKAERDAAYIIDFHFASRDDWAVIHDLRIEWRGRVAQIDHLLINRLLHVWLCESKHFSEGVAINEHGEFTAFLAGRPKGIESPIEQNHRHTRVLETVLGSSICPVPSRLGIELRPEIRSLVLVSPKARISRPKTLFAGLETIIKADQLRETINRFADSIGVAGTFLSAAKLIGLETLRDFAQRLAGLHRTASFDWPARFGLATLSPASPQSTPPLRVERSSNLAAVTSAKESSEQAPPTQVTQQVDLISTSKLAARLGFGSARQLLERLTAEGFLVSEAGGHALTQRGAPLVALSLRRVDMVPTSFGQPTCSLAEFGMRHSLLSRRDPRALAPRMGAPTARSSG